jgi:hypothetical protein
MGGAAGDQRSQASIDDGGLRDDIAFAVTACASRRRSRFSKRRKSKLPAASRAYENETMLGSVEDFATLYTKWFGEPDEVLKLDDVSIFVFAPSDHHDQPFWMYLTGGMSMREMALTPEARDAKVSSRAEYVFYSAKKDPRYLDMLSLLVVFPVVDKTSVSLGHTVVLAQPVDDVGTLNAVVLLKTLFRGHAEVFDSVRVGDDAVDYLWVVPITESERQYKRVRGINALLDVFADAKNPLVFAGDRDAYV